MQAINEQRVAEVMALTLTGGAHQPGDGGMCAMEAVAYVAGEPWSDEPECACPVTAAFMRSWNDALDDAGRERLLKPLIADLVGSRSTKAVEERRSYLALDWLIRIFAPKWLDMVPALHEHSQALRELDAITNTAGASAAGVVARAARDAARDAAWDAADAAAVDAADAAAVDAARAAAWGAARDADADAAMSALKPTKEWLQVSAVDLVRRMLAVQEPTEDRFCDTHCTWRDHRPDCVRSDAKSAQKEGE